MSMELLLEHFDRLLIIGLILALFFKESLTSFINAKLGVKERVPEWGARLVQYANHNTTDALNRLIDMEEKEHLNNDILRESIRTMNTTLLEFKEYGVKIRKE